MWAIGLFEGEGCISFFYKKKDLSPRMHMSLMSTDEDVIRRFLATVKVGSICGPYKLSGGRKPAWKWDACSHANIRKLLVPWLPQLCARRALKAKEALQFLDQKQEVKSKCKFGHPWTKETTLYLSKKKPNARRCKVCKDQYNKNWFRQNRSKGHVVLGGS